MITINLCRITPDRKYLEFNVETLSNYKFTHLYIWKYDKDNIWEITPTTTDLTSYLDKINNKEIKQLELSESSFSGPSLYYLTFVIEWDGTGTENEDAVLQANAVVVDVSQHYFTKVKLISQIDTDVSAIDKVIDMHIYESCMRSAIDLERWEDVNYFYVVLQKLMINNIVSVI